MSEKENKIDMKHSIKLVEYILWGVGLILVVTSLWYGLNFFVSVFIGVVIIIVNFILTKKAVSQVLVSESNTKNKMLFLYLLKIGISAILIYFAILHVGISPIGILVGVSSLFIAVCIYTLKCLLFN